MVPIFRYQRRYEIKDDEHAEDDESAKKSSCGFHCCFFLFQVVAVGKPHRGSTRIDKYVEAAWRASEGGGRRNPYICGMRQELQHLYAGVDTLCFGYAQVGQVS